MHSSYPLIHSIAGPKVAMDLRIDPQATEYLKYRGCLFRQLFTRVPIVLATPTECSQGAIIKPLATLPIALETISNLSPKPREYGQFVLLQWHSPKTFTFLARPFRFRSLIQSFPPPTRRCGLMRMVVH